MKKGNKNDIFNGNFEGIFAIIDIDNIDTDMLIPKQFLKTTSRIGLGKYLFYEKRYNDNMRKNNEFILNKKPFNKTEILVAGKNFGCGSSREHAPWALKDFGIKVIIAESFADIFYNNCFENLILPIILKKEEIDYIKYIFNHIYHHIDDYNNNDKTMENNNITDWFCETLKKNNFDTKKIIVNLKKQEVYCGEKVFYFEIDKAKKEKIINQTDTIDDILKKMNIIEDFEKLHEL